MNNKLEPIKKRNWSVFSIGLLLLFFGGFLFIVAVFPLIYDGFRIQFWNSTQANLLSVELEISYTNNHGSTEKISNWKVIPRGGKNSIYRTHAKYKYTINGKEFSNDRVSMGSSLNAESFELEIANQLNEKIQKQQIITIYYNPDNPADALVFRDIRWVSIFTWLIPSFLLLGIGFFMSYKVSRW